MKKRLGKQSVFYVVLLCFSLGLLVYFCVAHQNLATLLHTLPGLNLFWLSGAVLCMPAVWLMESLVFSKLITQTSGIRHSLRKSLQVTMVGQFFSAITPYGVGGQPMQFLALIRQRVSSGGAMAALVRKFLIYQSVLTVYSTVVIIIRYSYFQNLIPGFLMLVIAGFLFQASIVLLLVLFSRNRRFTTKLINGLIWLLSKIHLVKQLEETKKKVFCQFDFYLTVNQSMRRDRKTNLCLIFFNFLQLTLQFSIPFFIYKAFHQPGFPLIDMISAQSFVAMTSSCMPLPGSAGAAEGSFIALFQTFFSNQMIHQAMLLWRFISYYFGMAAGAFFALAVSHKSEAGLATGETDFSTKQLPLVENVPTKDIYAVSACLCGENCRFDGTNKLNKRVCEFAAAHSALLICPECLVLNPPRPACEIASNGHVCGVDGTDLTDLFRIAAEKTLDFCLKNGVTKAILKEKSPSCGVHDIYDGTFTGKLVRGSGMTAELLMEHGIKVISEDDFQHERWIF